MKSLLVLTTLAAVFVESSHAILGSNGFRPTLSEDITPFAGPNTGTGGFRNPSANIGPSTDRPWGTNEVAAYPTADGLLAHNVNDDGEHELLGEGDVVPVSVQNSQVGTSKASVNIDASGVPFFLARFTTKVNDEVKICGQTCTRKHIRQVCKWRYTHKVEVECPGKSYVKANCERKAEDAWKNAEQWTKDALRAKGIAC